MKSIDFITEAATPDDQLVDAMQRWFEMWQPATQVPIIMRSPRAEKFTKSNATKIYRAIVIPKAGSLKSLKSSSKFVTYTINPRLAKRFYDSLDISSDYIIAEKDFQQQDLILNFGAFAESLKQNGGWNEKELWMRPTPYYTTIKDSEIVFDSRDKK